MNTLDTLNKNFIKVLHIGMLCGISQMAYAEEASAPKTDIIEGEHLVCATGNLYPIDRIDSIVDGPSKRIIITQSEIERRGFEGRVSRNTVVDERIADQAADTFKITVENEDVTKFLRQFGLDEEKTKALWTTWRYWTEDEFYEDIKRMQRASQMFGYETESRMSISDEDIKQYYEEHPIIVPEAYQLETAFIAQPASEKKRTQLKNQLESFISGRSKYTVKWGKAVWNKREEISDKLAFVFGLKNGEIRLVEEPDGFLLVRLVEKREANPVSLNERRKDILMKLRQERYPKVMAEVKSKLRKGYSIYHPISSPEWINAL